MSTLTLTADRLLTAGPELAGHLHRHGALPWHGGPGRLVATAHAAGLTGRGGAGFPVWRKLAAVATGTRAVVVANGAEGEPASAKDVTLLSHAPHLILDGLQLAAECVGAIQAYLYLAPGPATTAAARAGGATVPLQAFLVGGFHGAWLPAVTDATPVSRSGLRPWNASPGAGVLIALPADACGLVESARIATPPPRPGAASPRSRRTGRRAARGRPRPGQRVGPHAGDPERGPALPPLVVRTRLPGGPGASLTVPDDRENYKRVFQTNW